MPDIKKRNRDPLSDDTYKANRNRVFIRENPKEYCPIVDTPKKMKMRTRKARMASAARPPKAARCSVGAAITVAAVSEAAVPADVNRAAVLQQYITVFGAPPPDEWPRVAGGGLINRILLNCRRPLGSYSIVKETILEYLSTGMTTKKGWSNRRCTLNDTSPYGKIVLACIASGRSIADATFRLNKARERDHEQPLSWSTVQRFLKKSKCVRQVRTIYVQQGKKDPTAPWSIARTLLAKRLLTMWETGQRLEASRTHGELPNTRKQSQDDFGLPPLFLDGILFPDEKHCEIIAGCPKDRVFQVAVDTSGEPCPTSLGGRFPVTPTRTKFKYDTEVRFCLGVAMVKGHSGHLRGVKMAPFEYTKRLVVGFATYEKEVKPVLAKLMAQQSVPFDAIYSHGTLDLRLTAEARVNKTHCCVKELIDHCVKEGNRIYFGTKHEKSWLLYHDALSSWWEGGSLQYLKEIGMYSRCVKLDYDPRRPQDEAIPASWRNRLPGDSPECSPCDSHSFAYLEDHMKANVHATYTMLDDDERKFKSGTPSELSRTLRRVWDVIPTSEQIIKDILHLPVAWEMIRKSKGTIVESLNNRRGRRGSGLKRAPRPSQRISTLRERELHPDVKSWCDDHLLLSIDWSTDTSSANSHTEIFIEESVGDLYFDCNL